MATLRLLPLMLISLAVACGDKDDSGAATADPDADGDGHPASLDCDDDDATVHPGAAEVCDGADNDCDGAIDDDDDSLAAGSVSVFFVDADGDGHGVAGDSITACEAPEGYAALADDCDDATDTTSPSAPEVCDDGVDNDCSIIIDCDDTACGGDGACAPDITALSRSRAPVNVPVPVIITGDGFEWDTAGAPTVSVGGVAATDVTVLDHTTLTATFPAAATAGVVDVSVTTDNDEAVLSGAFSYHSCIYAATGRAASRGSLYCIDSDDFSTFELGRITTPDGPVAITGMAVSPDGTIYATEPNESSQSRLFTLNPATGAATVVGALIDGDDDSEVHGSVFDLTFVGSNLVGWSHEYINVVDISSELVEINPATGQARYITASGATPSGYSGGLASDGAGTMYLVNSGLDGTLWSLTTTSATATNLGDLDDADLANAGASGLTFHEGTLFALDCDYGSSGACNLATISPTTLRVLSTTRGVSLPTGLSAIASPTP